MLPHLNLEFIMTRSTLTISKPSRSGIALEGDEGLETAAILASTSPLGITAMGAFPLSLIALGQIKRRHFDDTLTLRPKIELTSDDVRELLLRLRQRLSPLPGRLPVVVHAP